MKKRKYGDLCTWRSESGDKIATELINMRRVIMRKINYHEGEQAKTPVMSYI